MEYQPSDKRQRTDKSERERVLEMMEEGKLSESEGRQVLNALGDRNKEPVRYSENDSKGDLGNDSEEHEATGWGNSSIWYWIFGGVVGMIVGFCLFPISIFVTFLFALDDEGHTENPRNRTVNETETSNEFEHTELIDSPGEYALAPNEYKLIVALKRGCCGQTVQYTLKHTKHDLPTLASGEVGSNHSRWFFYWSDKKKLWIYSEDTGLTFLEPGEEREYESTRVKLNNQDVLAQIPDPVFQNLPLSLEDENNEPQQTDPDVRIKDHDDNNFRITHPIPKAYSYRLESEHSNLTGARSE